MQVVELDWLRLLAIGFASWQRTTRGFKPFLLNCNRASLSSYTFLYQSKQCFTPLAIKKEENTKSSAKTASRAVINYRFPSCLTRGFLRPCFVIQRVRGEIPMINPFLSTLVMPFPPMLLSRITFSSLRRCV